MLPNIAINKTIRINFAKRGRLKFISHLDMHRTFQSAIIRAKFPVWYTEGFNPHLRMTFALPLSVGIESECELLDLKVNGNADLDLLELKNRLEKFTADEIEIKDIYIPEIKFTEIAYAEYLIEICGQVDNNIFNSPVVLPKKTKKGESDIDITSMIYNIKFIFNSQETKIEAALSAGSENYLNPEYLIRAIEKYAGLEQNKFDYFIKRVNILDKNGNNFR